MTAITDPPVTEATVNATPESAAGKPALVHLPITPMQTLLLAVWFASIVSLLECGVIASWWFGLHKFLHATDHTIWMNPLGQLGVALLLALPFGILASRTKQCTEHLVCALFAFVVVLSLTGWLPGFANVARVLIAAGVAVQFGRWAERNPGATLGLARKSLVPLMVLIAGTVGCVRLMQTDWFNHSGSTTAAAIDAPNVLLVVMDTVRMESVDLDSPTTRTPNLRDIARESLVFDQARSTSPWTLPSHASILTGRMPSELTAGWHTPLDREFPTISEWLSTRGYRTGAFVANNWYCTGETGLSRGFHHYDDGDLTLGNVINSTGWGRCFTPVFSIIPGWEVSDNGKRRDAQSIRRDAVAWMSKRDDKPFFAMLNYFDAHDPYFAPSEFRSDGKRTEEQRVAELKGWWGSDKVNLSKGEADFQLQAYEDCIAWLDHELGLLLGELRESGQLDNTLVVITADHGEHFGDHELYGHGNSLYDPSIHVPLLLWHPQAVTAGSVKSTVSLIELPATIAAAISPAEDHPFPGQTLTRFDERFASAGSASAPVRSEILAPSAWPMCHGRSPIFRGAMKCVIVDNWKYILNGDGVEEIFDLAKDPGELNNLVEVVDETTLTMLRAQLGVDAHTSPIAQDAT